MSDPTTEELVARVRKALGCEYGLVADREDCAALDSLTVALERAERERDDAISRMEARIVGLIGDRNRAEARAQKAEAALDAIANCKGAVIDPSVEQKQRRIARAALSEEPR